MILIECNIERISNKEIKVAFPNVFVEQIHLKISPVNTPKTIHIWTDKNKEVGFIKCTFDKSKIFKKKIKLQIETSFLLLKCDPYNDFVEFLEIQVFALELFKELPSVVESVADPALPTVLESCTLAIPKEILLNVASSEFIQRQEALNSILSIVQEQPDNDDLSRCIVSLLNFLLVDNRPKIVLIRIKLAAAINDLVHLERILENSYDYHEYIQTEIINVLVSIKFPLNMLLKNKPKLIPICLQVIERCQYKPTQHLAEYVLLATKTPNRSLALALWYEIQPKLEDKVIMSMVEANIENDRLKAILFKNMDVLDDKNKRYRPATASNVDLRSRPSTASTSNKGHIKKSKSQPVKLNQSCVFCEQDFHTHRGLEDHYFECPMLMLCKECDEIIEVSAYHSHSSHNKAHDNLSEYTCPFCYKGISPENINGWRLHLLGLNYSPVTAKDTKIPVRQRHCSSRKVGRSLINLTE